MVSLKAVQASNALIGNTLPSGLIAVFVGGTSGIGEYTLLEFARQARQPRIYSIGRSQEASDRIAAEVRKLNPEAQYTFIQSDVSLIRNVDVVCEQIKAKEKTVNILCQSQGTLVTGIETKEGLHLNAALKHHSRGRFIFHLLPLIKAAPDIRRVLSILCGTKEGPINLADLQNKTAKSGDVLKNRSHSGSIFTMIHAHFAAQAPTVSFIHDYPGAVKSGIGRGTTGMLWGMFTLAGYLGPLVFIPERESGERHLFYATSARYQAREGVENAVPLGYGVGVAMGIDGKEGSGIYSADEKNESAGPAVVELLEGFRKEGMPETIWGKIEEEYERIAKLPKE